MAATALAAAFAQVTLGGVVRVTGSGLGCPDWPLCHGSIVPPFDLATLIEYSHRLAATAVGILVLGVAVLAWLFYRSNHWVLASSVLGFLLVLAAAVLGGVTVWTELAWWVRMVHLGIALLVVACMVIPSIVGLNPAEPRPLPEHKPSPTRPSGLLLLAALAGLFALILSGSYMVGYGASSSCATWPLCRGSVMPDGAVYLIHMSHRYLAAAVGLLLVVAAISVWSHRGERRELAWASLVLIALFSSQVIAGAATVWTGFSVQMKALHLSLASLVWIALVSVAALVFTTQPLQIGRKVEEPGPAPRLERSTP